ncbi:lipopolysaccharide heptosyltransferase family protein [Chryseobacterium sp. GMJ5]|uniref:Lipopolysaccharide heptosyltransferase family protein n=1 Tax=Chryseobacterium gilvum TaxID=2976534 RepID=A0ABT2VVC0_9FLAO|nr:glycosyltransferase family 9 protein [Chryseobacterium gilvum]MCU7613936.1 lipopolysaccharide heptosyltransferase family protein [Chryseobacterium gilvum]
MKISKKINAVRRSVMQNLTKNIGKSHSTIGNKEDLVIRKVLITRPNHRLGNLLLITPLVNEIHRLFPDSKVDLFVKGGASPTIFKNFKNVDRIIQLPKKPFSNLFQYLRGWALLKTRKYDLVINSTSGSSSGKLSTSFARSGYKVFSDFDEELNAKYSDYRHMSKNTIYNLRDYLSKLGFDDITAGISDLDLKLDPSEIGAGKEKLNNLVQNDRDTICLYTNATGEKCYSEDWWQKFYEQLKINFPDYNIIELLPVENTSKLNFKIPHFYSKDIREMGGFLKNVSLFIAADNGVMHLASASGAPTIGLFSVSDQDMYAPYNGESFSVNTNHTDQDHMMQLIHGILDKR